MIEVEIKVPISEENVARLTDGAEFLGEKRYRDVYYDNEKYDLTIKSIWLRKRNDKHELKYPIGGFDQGLSNRYIEYETDSEIKDVLSLNRILDIEEAIIKAGYMPFSDYVTHRRSYKNGLFNIDIDEASFGYSLCEVECIIDDKEKIVETEEKITKYMSDRGVNPDKLAIGKMIMYLKQERPQHLEELLKHRVITVN